MTVFIQCILYMYVHVEGKDTNKLISLADTIITKYTHCAVLYY